MIAYLVQGASPLSVLDDPRVARLLPAGPWQAQLHAAGALIVQKSDDGAPVRLSDLGRGRLLADGLTYFGPKVKPPFRSFLSRRMVERDDVVDVRINRDEEQQIVRIVPAYSSPRKIMEDNTLGEFSTKYGRLVRALLDKISSNPSIKFESYADELFEVCRLAIMHTHPSATRELIADYGILDVDSIFEIWEAAIHVPKDSSGPGADTSASQSPAVI